MNILGIVTWILSIILIFSLAFRGFTLNKTAITAEDFSAKATASGFSVVDVSEQYDGETVISLLAVDSTESFQIEYHLFENRFQASNAFYQNKATLNTNAAGSYSSFNGMNWASFYKTADGTYGFVSYIDKTLIYARVPQEHKQAVQDFLKD